MQTRQPTDPQITRSGRIDSGMTLPITQEHFSHTWIHPGSPGNVAPWHPAFRSVAVVRCRPESALPSAAKREVPQPLSSAHWARARDTGTTSTLSMSCRVHLDRRYFVHRQGHRMRPRVPPEAGRAATSVSAREVVRDISYPDWSSWRG